MVVLPDGDPAAPHRDSRYWRGWPVELFVHDATTLNHYLGKDFHQRRPTMHRMIATGVLLIGDRAQAAQIQVRCAAVLAAGPPPLTDGEQASARYGLTDLLDDLTHAKTRASAPSSRTAYGPPPPSTHSPSAGTGPAAASGLLRELRDMDPHLAMRWLAAHEDVEATTTFAREILQRAGGPLFAGYRADGERTRC